MPITVSKRLLSIPRPSDRTHHESGGKAGRDSGITYRRARLA
jgi:hypothetical protein